MSLCCRGTWNLRRRILGMVWQPIDPADSLSQISRYSIRMTIEEVDLMNEHIKNQFEIMSQQVKELAALYHSAAGKSGVSDNEFWIWYTLLFLGGIFPAGHLQHLVPAETDRQLCCYKHDQKRLCIPGNRPRHKKP